jgi:hypothetical protein
MIHPKLFPVFLLIPLLLTSCFKKDEAIPRHQRGNVRTDTIAMTQDYKYQVYFDLASESKVNTNLKTDADIGFECAAGGWHIILNTADFAKVADLGIKTFGEPQDTTGAIWKFDKSDGNPDSIAIGQWYTVSRNDTVTNNHVYIVNCGMDENGNNLGFFQVIFDSLKHDTYYFRFAPMRGGTIVQASVPKDPDVHYVYYDLVNGGAVKQLEPAMSGWDLLFTQYSTLLFTDAGQAYPYLVTGVLVNRGKVQIAVDTIHNFADINYDMARAFHYSSAMDAIGYDWKVYNFDAGTYTVRTGLNFVISDKNGFLYKLRFIGFNNASGAKGYPVFEYQGL